MRRTKTAAVAVATLAAALALTACDSGTDSTDNNNAANSGTLTLGSLQAPTTQEAANSAWANASPYVQAVYDSLLRSTPEGKIVPWLATSWSYNTDKTVLTMKLRTDVTFTDGTAFNASAAAQNLLRFREGTSMDKGQLALVKDAKAVDDSTFEITLTAPDPSLLLHLSQEAGAQASPASFDAADAKTKPVGSGPYVLDTAKTVVGSKYVYTRNPRYVAPDQQHYANLVINVYQTAAAQVDAIKAGQVNALNLFDNSLLNQAKASAFTAYPVTNDWVGLALMDRAGKDTPALGDVRVRQAINYALDRKALLKAAGQNFGQPTTQIFSPRSPGYDKALEDRYPYDPAKAKALLAEAGQSSLTLTLPQVTGLAATAYDLVKQYLKDVGITVNYQAETVQTVIADLLAPKFSAAQFQLAMYPDAWQTAANYLAPTATFNPYRVADPTVGLLTEKIQTGSQTDADAAATQLNKYIVEQGWFAPIYRSQANFVADSKTSVVQQPDNAYPYLWNIKPKK